MEKYQTNGKEIFDKYCSSAGNQPTMLPRAPEQTYIDVYPDEDQPGRSFKDERQRQSDYEAEVKVYRALEGLEENLIVLHSFQYTHDQYCLCDTSHKRDRKKCNKCKNQFNKEGECDFLVLGPDYCVIMEVKNMSHVEHKSADPEPEMVNDAGDDMDKQIQALVGTFRKSVEQREKIAFLIKCIDKDTTVLQFTAYPNFSKLFKEQFQLSEKTELRLSDAELSTIIFEEDISDHIKDSSTAQSNPEQNCFSRLFRCLTGCCNRTTDRDDENNTSTDENVSSFGVWWADNVTQTILSARRTPVETTSDTEISRYNPDSHENIRNIMLAIWATEKNKCDQSKCSLGRSIMDIDKRLKEGHITFQPKKGKNRNQNPGVVKAPDVIRKYVGVLYLTSQQNNVFNSSEKLLWINGPAGAGKTVILCGTIIQLVQSDKNSKVVLFRWTGKGNNSELYQRALDKANVRYQQINTSEHTTSELVNLISESECNVIIVEITGYIIGVQQFTDILSVVNNCNIFIDDIQELLYYYTTNQCSVLIDKLLELPLQCTVRIACDMVQRWGYYSDTQRVINIVSMISDKLSDNQLTSLSMNLRNTCDLSTILCVIRDQYVRLVANKMHVLPMILPTQIPGHFIHGPKTVIHILSNYDLKMIGNILNDELDKLSYYNNNVLNNSDIGIVYDYISDVVSLVKDTVNTRCNNTDDKIAVCNVTCSFSAEWPAVIVLHNMYRYDEWELPELYLMISRARVHCSVVIYPREGRTLDDYRDMLDFLDTLKDHVRIIRH